MSTNVAYRGEGVFDGTKLHWGKSLVLSDGIVEGFVENELVSPDCNIKDFTGQIVSPGFVDLQVNGGGGVLLSNDPSLETIERMSNAHLRTGTTALLPTLTTDTPDKVDRAIDAVSKALKSKVPGIVGLHLEGPHLAKSKKGAHDASLIRSMEARDLETLCNAAKHLPSLMITVAIESVSSEQIRKLSEAGAIVSLGHTNGDYEACMAAVAAGATCATHLFNAMSQTCGRSPGLVGAVLSNSQLSAGIIADGHHVHPANIDIAYHAKAPTQGLFLVSDAMALTGSSATQFEFGGRIVERRNGRLELADGTLSGADIDLASSVQNLMKFAHLDLAQALACATSVPASAIKRSSEFGRFCVGEPVQSVICLEANNVSSVTYVKTSGFSNQCKSSSLPLGFNDPIVGNSLR